MGWALKSHVLVIKAWGFAVDGWASKSYILHVLTRMPMWFLSQISMVLTNLVFCLCSCFSSRLFHSLYSDIPVVWLRCDHIVSE